MPTLESTAGRASPGSTSFQSGEPGRGGLNARTRGRTTRPAQSSRTRFISLVKYLQASKVYQCQRKLLIYIYWQFSEERMSRKISLRWIRAGGRPLLNLACTCRALWMGCPVYLVQAALWRQKPQFDPTLSSTYNGRSALRALCLSVLCLCVGVVRAAVSLLTGPRSRLAGGAPAGCPPRQHWPVLVVAPRQHGAVAVHHRVKMHNIYCFN